ncbi:uncharacterized protein METZ01_LOCUS43682, partial [marine metagenome]
VRTKTGASVSRQSAATVYSMAGSGAINAACALGARRLFTKAANCSVWPSSGSNPDRLIENFQIPVPRVLRSNGRTQQPTDSRHTKRAIEQNR